jgi:multidrug resistance efflux pump
MARFLRVRVLPWAVWLGTMAAAAWLWQGVHGGSARGFVEAVGYDVAASATARIESVLVTAGQRVRAGQPIAALDAHELTAELEILAAERQRIEAELGAVTSDTQLRLGDTSRQIAESLAESERLLQTTRAERAVHAAEFAALSDQLEVLKGLVDKRMADRRELDVVAVKHAALKKELQVVDALIAQLVAQVSAARGRSESLPTDATERATEPLRAELAVIRRREELLQMRKEALILRAPGDGEVTMLHLRPGEVALAGTPIATIASADSNAAAGQPRVFVCLDEAQAGRLQAGEAAMLHPVTPGAAPVPAHLERLDPAVTELPIRCWRDPKLPQWGRAAHVVPDLPASLVSGQGFTVAFQGHRSTHAGEPAPVIASAAVDQAPAPKPTYATDAAPASPLPIKLPPALMARSRFEPSALLWSPQLDRFVVVSDDTGLADTSEHMPWLFTMDVRGQVDGNPLIIAGIDKLSDLESIAPAPDGGLYVLASQSRSRKGKRPPARQRLVHVALSPGGARASAMVALAGLLDSAGRDTLAGLGLPGTADLDIEGMTATAAGGLLLGLKGPLGPRDEAQIWHLGRPDALLATGELAAGQLALWGRVPLTVQGDGANMPGGIADLLELPDGSLLIAATAAGSTDPTRQDGALYHVADRAGLAQPRLVRSFPGRKPEGLARSGSGNAIVIVFDAGADAPLWMEQPWPAP